jgi:biotin operon repressor
MGRPTFFRQRLLTQAASLEAKSLFNYLVSEIKARREVSLEEAVLIAHDAQNYLEENLLTRAPGQIEFPAIAGRDNHQKRSRAAQAERIIKLTVVAEEDIELMAEFGVVAMQKGRLFRLIEEAYAQDAILDGHRLAVLLLQTHRGWRAMLAGMWDKGVILPVAGMQKTSREKMLSLRGAVAVDRYLGGEDLTSIRKEMAVSTSRWQRWWQGFKEVVKSKDQPLTQIQERLHQPPELIRAWLEVWDKHKEKNDLISRLDLNNSLISPASGISQQAFYERLRTRHGYSPAAAEQFLDELRDLATVLNRQERASGAIIYHGVSDQEPAGKRLTDCQLKAVVLDWIAQEDFELANRDNIGRLAWARLMRLATQARSQGAALSQPDLALLLGMSTTAVQDLLKEHPEVVVPTRGLVADMGPALSHAEKIIRLYMDGYTETEIVRRTGHSYEAIENYLLDFARVVYLVERGLPVPAIRQALGCSKRLVEKHVNLYREFSGSDYAFTMAKIRRLAEAHRVKKNKPKGD